ncbi:hypothetical protein DKK70_04450 [Gilliamella apicola]|uniref:Uncharacterized protein n=1 Tax=Gilliamella apicola TaxID=1196095 RepID=A0A2V4EBY1_9GAMM|nr:hypothetical protein DKK70_04450 [Gilliamella apicola]
MLDKYQVSFSMMGKNINLLIFHYDDMTLIKEIYHMLEKFDLRFSVNRDNFELMIVNKNSGIKPIKVNTDLYQLVNMR